MWALFVALSTSKRHLIWHHVLCSITCVTFEMAVKFWYIVDTVFLCSHRKSPKEKIRTFQRPGSMNSLAAPIGKHLMNGVKLSIALTSAEQQMELTQELKPNTRKKPSFLLYIFTITSKRFPATDLVQNPAFLEYFIFKCHLN